MRTEEAKESITYSSMVSNILALREEVREASPEEAKALDKIVSDITAVQIYDRYVAEIGMCKS